MKALLTVAISCLAVAAFGFGHQADPPAPSHKLVIRGNGFKIEIEAYHETIEAGLPTIVAEQYDLSFDTDY